MSLEALRATLARAVMSTVQPQTRVQIPGILDELGVPTSSDDPALSKAKYIESRLVLLTDPVVVPVTERFLAQLGQSLNASIRFELEELLWQTLPTVGINKRARHEVARALRDIPLFLRATSFLNLVSRLWDRSTSTILDALLGNLGDGSHSLLAQVEQHLVRNPDDWSPEEFFERLGAFDASDRRFGLLVEGLVAPDVRPDEESQRAFVTAVNGALSGSGVELREVGQDGGFPVFRLAVVGRGAGTAKNLIFASPRKPDLRFRDAVNNDIEIVDGADQVLVYDRPFPAHGFRWRDLQAWWAESRMLDEESAKTTLYRRLLSALPDNSPPQVLLFKSFFKHFGSRVRDLPALLPEVWLHWDPKTARERGPAALARHRMDFLLLLPGDVRVVVEVDGAHHYASDAGRADPEKYAAMASADRDLRLAGYDVFRFGAVELDPVNGPERVGEFFERLFARHGIMA